jgi:predicted alpha/beta hydrolase family esterase
MSTAWKGTQRVLVLPGWLSSGAAHWQSRWEALLGFQRVEQADWEWPLRGDWMARLDEVIAGDPTPALLVAHSLGCQLVAAWAAHSRHSSRVQAAFLVAPPDVEREDMPPQVFSWRPIVRRPLPFPAIVVCSDDDPFCALPRAREMAADWGTRTEVLSGAGHINADSGLGDWPEGLAMLAQLGR